MSNFGLNVEVLNWSSAMTILSMIIGVIFLYAAGAKLASWNALVGGLAQFGVRNGRVAHFVALSLTIIEAVIGAGHLARIGMSIVLPLAIALLLLFFGKATLILARKQVRPCLCFGASGDVQVDILTLARTGLLLLADIVLLLFVLRGELVGGGGWYQTVAYLPGTVAAAALIGWAFSGWTIRRVWGALE